jgi:hypothetical protein
MHFISQFKHSEKCDKKQGAFLLFDKKTKSYYPKKSVSDSFFQKSHQKEVPMKKSD